MTWFKHVLSSAVAAAFVAVAGAASAAPEAHILRIDPRASTTDGSPVLTTVIELVQNKRMSELTGECATLSGNANLACVANKLEAPGALYSSFPFPKDNAVLTVTVDGSDLPAKFVDTIRWQEAAAQPGVGTAWLIVIDAASTMGTRFDEAKAVGTAFVNAMGPNDIVDVMFFNDRAVVKDSKWLNNKAAAAGFIGAEARTYPTQGRTRPLFNIIKSAATDGFKELGNAGQAITVPLHQAMVVLSNGSAGGDPSSVAATATLLKEYLTKGRFPEDNPVLPKTPVPVISVFFPSVLIEEFGANAREFMEGMANPEIGGFYSIVQNGESQRAVNIVNSVRTRFNKMHVVKWRVSCVAPTVTQTFKLFFANTNPPIAGDATFKDVPVGIDPTTWPLDVDREATEKEAKKNPIYPGGTAKIFGNFCWGGNQQRAEIYMVPKTQAAPASLQGGSIEDAKKAQRSLIEQGMRGKASSAGDSVVEFELPNSDKFLVGKGDAMTGRLIVYDNAARRTSAVTADKIVTLAARGAPLPYLLIAGITFGGVVLVLLVVNLVRGGGSKRRGGGGAAQPPKPIIAGAAPPPMGGGMGGGMGGPSPYYGGGPPPGPPAGDYGYGGGPPVHTGPAPAYATRATISGGPGIFTVMPGSEMRAGRDGAPCQILLSEPRVSGVHATLKFDSGQLFVRDENSNNGTSINNQRIQGSIWTPVPHGAALRFGPVEFSVRLE
ncbi:MAG: FHA domain-containing protein [Polyangiaceae bacterium]